MQHFPPGVAAGRLGGSATCPPLLPGRGAMGIQKFTGDIAREVHAGVDIDDNRAVALCGAYVVRAHKVEATRHVSCPVCERKLRAERRRLCQTKHGLR